LWGQHIDKYYARNPTTVQPVPQLERDPPPHLSANFIEIEEGSDDATNVGVYLEALMELVDKAKDPQAIERIIRVLQLRTKEAKKVRPKKDARFQKVSTIEVTEAQDFEDTHTEDEKPAPKALASKKTPYVDVPPRPPVPRPNCPRRPGTAQPTASQFKYRSPLKASVSSDNVVQKILSQQVSLLVAEAIALCPEVRKFFKEGTTTCCIPTSDSSAQMGMVLAFYSALEEEEDLVKGVHSLPLRTLQVSLNKEITVTAIIDSGY